VTQNNSVTKTGRSRESAIDGRTKRHEGYGISQSRRAIVGREVKAVKDFIGSQHMQDVFKRVNAMSTAPLEFIWLEELAP
jgi:hypothetical protein